MDPQAFQKNQKRHFFRDIEKSFQEVTPIGPEPHKFFFLFEISQQIQSLEASKLLAEMAKICCNQWTPFGHLVT